MIGNIKRSIRNQNSGQNCISIHERFHSLNIFQGVANSLTKFKNISFNRNKQVYRLLTSMRGVDELAKSSLLVIKNFTKEEF